MRWTRSSATQSKAERLLGWKPEVLVEDLARIMVDADIRQVQDELSGVAVRVDR